jgi:hypothetical protein
MQSFVFVINLSNKKLRFCVAMGGGRKNLKRATEEKHVTLQDGQCIMQVVSLRGSNLIEVVVLLICNPSILSLNYINKYNR